MSLIQSKKINSVFLKMMQNKMSVDVKFIMQNINYIIKTCIEILKMLSLLLIKLFMWYLHMKEILFLINLNTILALFPLFTFGLVLT